MMRHSGDPKPDAPEHVVESLLVRMPFGATERDVFDALSGHGVTPHDVVKLLAQMRANGRLCLKEGRWHLAVGGHDRRT